AGPLPHPVLRRAARPDGRIRGGRGAAPERLMLLRDKVVVTSGPAEAIAAACAREGATVVPAADTGWDRVDCLVHVLAGGEQPRFEDADLAQWRAQVEADVFGPLHVTSAAVAPMKGHGGGSIVFVNALPDGAARAALLTGVHVLAKELGPDKIRVNTVVPGPRAHDDGVADAVVFFASDLSTIVTGQTLDVAQ